MSKRLRTESLSSPPAGSNGTQEDDNNTRTEQAVHTPKYASLEPEEAAPSPTIQCHLPPHKALSFISYSEYESHYTQAHTNRCSECKKNLPTSHFLNLHIAENHDPILASKEAAGDKIYGCFVEGCEKVCRDWRKRRSHLVDKHGYPKNYDFLVVNNGIDGRWSMLRPGIDSDGHRKSSRERRKSNSVISESTQSTEATSVGEQNSTEEPANSDLNTSRSQVSEQTKSVAKGDSSTFDVLTSSMSALRMIPRSITFGQRKGRAGFAKR